MVEENPFEVISVPSEVDGPVQCLHVPKDTEDGTYICQCAGCEFRQQKTKHIRNSFFYGIVFPILWIHIIGLYFYSRFLLDNEVTHEAIADEHLPTQYEKDKYREQHILRPSTKHIDCKIQPEINEGLGLKRLESSKSDIESNASSDSLCKFRDTYLKQCAENIVQSHAASQKLFLGWALKTLLMITTYSVILAFSIMLGMASSSGKL